jgi:hypothetical protein
MTNKMKLVFLITTTLSVIFVVLSTPSAGDIFGRLFSSVVHKLGLHEALQSATLVVLLMPALYYLAFRQ